MNTHYDQNPSIHTLTVREKEVLKLRIQGHTRKQIASCLHIAESTAKKHLENIYRKLGVSTQVELIQLIHKKE
ncbi:MAG: response regulator transcription factor [Peptococcaceae bacterium]|nr:response regulator transcription factor [Peptococcaceae bacterium]